MSFRRLVNDKCGAGCLSKVLDCRTLRRTVFDAYLLAGGKALGHIPEAATHARQSLRCTADSYLQKLIISRPLMSCFRC